jgi:hypothetical protein
LADKNTNNLFGGRRQMDIADTYKG